MKDRYLRPFLVAGAFSLLAGCASVIQTQRALDNVGRYYLAIEPTERVYIVGQTGYIEFAKSRYIDHVSLKGEDIHLRWLTREPSESVQFVYLCMKTPSITGPIVFERLNSKEGYLLDAKEIPFVTATVIPFSRAFKTTWDNNPDHLQVEGYPFVLEESQGWAWYMAAPLQVPAFILDYGVTLAFLPFGGMYMLFNSD